MKPSYWFAAALGLLGCSNSTTPRDEAAPACDPQRLTREGHLPACAAGTTSPSGPGVPADVTTHAAYSLALSADEAAAAARANERAAARRSGHAVDHGFAAPRAK